MWATAVCVYLCLNWWYVYVMLSVGVRLTVNVESLTRLRNHREILWWFASFYVGVSLKVSPSYSLIFFVFVYLSFFSPLSRAHVCLYVLVYWDLLKIRNRKPIYRGYLRKVSLFVSCEIETLPFASLFLSLFPPFEAVFLSTSLSCAGGGSQLHNGEVIREEIRWLGRNEGIS